MQTFNAILDFVLILFIVVNFRLPCFILLLSELAKSDLDISIAILELLDFTVNLLSMLWLRSFHFILNPLHVGLHDLNLVGFTLFLGLGHVFTSLLICLLSTFQLFNTLLVSLDYNLISLKCFLLKARCFFFCLPDLINFLFSSFCWDNLMSFNKLGLRTALFSFKSLLNKIFMPFSCIF